ncbi:hypothetical protein M752DRAFT_157536 [Aspergillus phoenicis ATCC 13157]|uniref:Uncharacterized protein n=1 Tax=Aspergillus phoenicis ATCC 13157 TaxID=1353007 RepID=A0A370PMP1_ASPPH|nr:hypothetical protein M752DRAFT_157536 [Aspergillus phoenicis ATCC 13157]
MAGIGGGSNYGPGGDSEFTTQNPWGSERTTTAEYYPGETTRTTTQQWTPITTSESSSQPTTTTATTTHSSSTSSSTSTTAVKSTSSTSSSSNNTKTIAIAVPVAVVGAAIIAALLFFILRRRRQQRTRSIIPQTNNDNPPVSMGAVPRQVRSPPQQRRPQLAANGATWEFAPTNSHDIPFTGPIPGRPVSGETEHIIPTNNQPRDFSPPTTNNHNFHTAATAAAAAGAGTAAAAAAEVPNRDNNSYERSPQPTMPAAWPSPEARLDRPISPFDHPLDDAVSEISRRSYTHARDMDDVSSVSSFEDDERRPAMHR